MNKPCPECAAKFLTKKQIELVFKPIRELSAKIIDANHHYKNVLRNISIGGIGETMWTVDEIRAYANDALDK